MIKKNIYINFVRSKLIISRRYKWNDKISILLLVWGRVFNVSNGNIVLPM